MSGRKFVLVVMAVLSILAARFSTTRGDERSIAAGAPQAPAIAIAPVSGTAAWPVALARNPLEPALRDPFASPRPLAPLRATVQAPPPVLQTAAPSPPAAAPPLEPGLAFTGRMVTPDGRTVIIASLGADTLTLRPGQQLPNGFRVDAIATDAVLLSHPALAQPARLAIPPAPSLPTR